MEIRSYSVSARHDIREAKIVRNNRSSKRHLINHGQISCVNECDAYFSCEEEM